VICLSLLSCIICFTNLKCNIEDVVRLIAVLHAAVIVMFMAFLSCTAPSCVCKHSCSWNIPAFQILLLSLYMCVILNVGHFRSNLNRCSITNHKKITKRVSSVLYFIYIVLRGYTGLVVSVIHCVEGIYWFSR
jgi:formate-dependent nitrite reductase membrane component NrfD